MPCLRLHTSNRLEILADRLAEVLAVPPASPFESEVILVQSKGMERWTSLQLARRLGICANVRFPFPNHFVQDLFRQVVPDLPDRSPFDPDVLTWRILGLLPLLLDRPAFEPLRRYLGKDAPELKRFQIAARIADTFDQYLLFRPEMVLRWDAGLRNHWQAVLWRELSRGREGLHRASLRNTFLRALERGAPNEGTLPGRVAVFGVSALPRFHIEVLAALSRRADVHLFILDPCREYWGDIVSGPERKRIEAMEARKGIGAGDLHLTRGNSLLASMGLLGRDFFELLRRHDPEDLPDFKEPVEKGLLQALQLDLLNLIDRGRGGGEKTLLSAGDETIRIASCHSPMREVEILQDYLLRLFEMLPGLRPADILVMTPDIEAYAPFIEAVFSLPQEDPRRIPFAIADRGARIESPLIEAFLSLLGLPRERMGAAQVLAFLQVPALRARFGLTEGDLEKVEDWIRETRIRWGVDGKSREAFGLPGLAENTWRQGIDRMLLGYALPEKDDRMVSGIYPYGRIEGSEAGLLGRFLGFTERLFASIEALKEKRNLGEWGRFLDGLIEAFFLEDPDTGREVRLLRQAVQDLVAKEEAAAFREKVGLDIIRSSLESRFEAEGFGMGFMAGGMTFCAMLPMRSIPFRVLCLIGMNGDAYPRQSRPHGFDLMAKRPQPGDRSARNDDRYLFLEAILSARERLYLSHVGQDIRDNALHPPSVLVSELLDTVEQGFLPPEGTKTIDEHLIVRHRLQGFSPAYFKAGSPYRSYSKENFEALERARAGSGGVVPFLAGRLQEPGEEWRAVSVEDLCRFFAHPARYLLQRRLGLSLEEGAALLEEDEPFELAGLDRYHLEQELVERGLRKGDLAAALPVLRARGELPHGTPGECVYDRKRRDVKAFLRSLDPILQTGPLPPLDVDLLLDGFRVTGRIDRIYGSGLLHYRFAKARAKDRLRLWIHHLLLNHDGAGPQPCRCMLICENLECRYAPVEKSEAFLKGLLSAYWQGLARSLSFLPESSWAYADAVRKGLPPEEAMAKARLVWEGNDFSRGESQDPYNGLCFRGRDPLGPEFAALALELLGPILDHEEKR
jgi:exodeoxyribonuclease V gamma subunit